MEVKWPNVRRAALEMSRPILGLVGTVHIPPRYRSVTSFEAGMMASKVIPGDILLSHRNYEPTNPIIPGKWKHAAMYVGDGDVIEAVGSGVKLNSLVEFCTTKDAVVALRPRFATGHEGLQASLFAISLRGLPYDYLVEHDFSRAVNKAFYCSEIPWWSYEQVFVAQGKPCPFTPRLTMGVPTVTPQDFYNAGNLFSVVLILSGETKG